MEKAIKKYSKLFRSFIKNHGMHNAQNLTREYSERLREMYASDDFAMHNVYPTMNVEKIYAVICMCLVLKENGLNEEEIINLVGTEYHKTLTIRAFCGLERFLDHFMNTYALAKKWNREDHASRLKDGSISYDYFTITDEKISYCICKCMYVEMFEYYGIRSCCKIFCQDDYLAYEGLSRHLKFVRHSDLASGDCCRDEVLNLKCAK